VNPLLAITRVDVADYVGALFTVYFILIFIRVLLSWIPRCRTTRGCAPASTSSTRSSSVSEPLRRVIPPLGERHGDRHQPILAIIILFIVGAWSYR